MNDDDECKRRSCATDICSRLESQQAAAVAAQTNNIGEENNVDPSSSENDNTAVDGHTGNDEGIDNDCCYKGRQFAVLICISLDDHLMVNEFEIKNLDWICRISGKSSPMKHYFDRKLI